MKLPFLLTTLILTASPALAVDDGSSERIRGYFYGYIYGTGATLCDLVINKRIEKKSAKEFLSGVIKDITEDPDNKPYTSDMRAAYKDVTEFIDCKEVYQ